MSVIWEESTRAVGFRIDLCEETKGLDGNLVYPWVLTHVLPDGVEVKLAEGQAASLMDAAYAAGECLRSYQSM